MVVTKHAVRGLTSGFRGRGKRFGSESTLSHHPGVKGSCGAIPGSHKEKKRLCPSFPIPSGRAACTSPQGTRQHQQDLKGTSRRARYARRSPSRSWVLSFPLLKTTHGGHNFAQCTEEASLFFLEKVLFFFWQSASSQPGCPRRALPSLAASRGSSSWSSVSGKPSAAPSSLLRSVLSLGCVSAERQDCPRRWPFASLSAAFSPPPPSTLDPLYEVVPDSSGICALAGGALSMGHL